MFDQTFKLHSDEHIIFFIRKHWIFFLLDVLGIFFLFLIPASIVWFCQYMDWMFTFKVFGITFYSLTDILIYMWAIFCWLMLAERFTDYALDFWVVTNKRIVESELIKLFDHRVSTLELQDIEDITVREEGFWSNYFNFGTLEVQTAGTKTEFSAPQIASPESVQQIIFDAKLKDEHERKNIEKEEIEQISHRVVREEKTNDLKENLSDTENFDWAHANQESKDKYEDNIDKALRIE